MEFFVPLTPAKAVRALKKRANEEGMGDKVRLTLERGALTVVVSYRGTSTLVFSHNSTKRGTDFVLESKDVAFFHRPFMGTVMPKLKSIAADSHLD